MANLNNDNEEPTNEGRAYKELDAAARQAGTNLAEVCRRYGIARSQLQYWKDKDPRSLEIYFGLKEAIKKIEAENKEKPAG